LQHLLDILEYHGLEVRYRLSLVLTNVNKRFQVVKVRRLELFIDGTLTVKAQQLLGQH